MAVIDSDPYEDSGENWWVNQNNFFREISNVVIDITGIDGSKGAGIHWQVAQATSLTNIRFEMVKGGTNNTQQGIFMDNGSGGFMSDLTFNGGNQSVFFGNQQFTTRNLTFNDCMTAIKMNWNWIWLLKSVTVNNCQVGLDISSKNESVTTDVEQSVGSAILQDSVIHATKAGVLTAWAPSTWSNGSLVLDNVDFSKSAVAIGDVTGKTVLAGGSKVASWSQGHGYSTGATLTAKRSAGLPQIPLQGGLKAPKKPAVLLDSTGKFVERSRPQYENVPASSFVSVKDQGAKGDGATDDTAAIQRVLLSACPKGSIVYFDHGAYLITKTVTVPANCKILGEFWPLIMADGKSFNDVNNPKPVWQVGLPGDKGNVEIVDIMFETKGNAPGAIMMEWNLAGSTPGGAGMWNTHFRIGGTAGTGLQADHCTKKPEVQAPADPRCVAAFMLLHITKSASLLMENNWMWVADHEMDQAPNNQINIYNGRGVLIESQGPLWMYGTSSEHHQLYNYQLHGAQNVYMGVIQTETAYMQPNPDSLTPFAPNAKYSDPTFADCTDGACKKTWGLRIVDSRQVFIYGAGLYSFFDNWAQECFGRGDCQTNMFSIDTCSSDVYLFTLATKAAVNMATVGGQPSIARVDNKDTFCDLVAVFEKA